MNYEIVELGDFPGSVTGIYSVLLEGEGITLFDRFIKENLNKHRDEVKFILDRLRVIASKTGARENFFKVGEGNLGDGVCALYDDPLSKLRVYCIRYGSTAIILGGGGPKSKSISAYQEDKKLNKEAEIIKKISKDIIQKIKDKEIRWSPDGTKLLGNLTFTDNEEE